MVDVVLRTNVSSRYQTLAGTCQNHASSDPNRAEFQWLSPQSSLEDARRSPRTMSAEGRRQGRPRTDEGAKLPHFNHLAFSSKKANFTQLVVPVM